MRRSSIRDDDEGVWVMAVATVSNRRRRNAESPAMLLLFHFHVHSVSMVHALYCMSCIHVDVERAVGALKFPQSLLQHGIFFILLSRK